MVVTAKGLFGGSVGVVVELVMVAIGGRAGADDGVGGEGGGNGRD